ncbi:MAG: PTS sugar transporter subunit IIA [Acidobacteriota bacterium]|nr:PTS sugar transporter subunit IIA [Acidobacteriota bacterium]
MSDFVKASQVFLDNPATTVDEAFGFLAKKAVELGLSDDEAAVVDAFKEREALGSTGMQGGFAIPHCKSAAINDAAVFVVKFAGDIAWDSMDGQPIKVAIALFAPDGDVHLSLLSQVAIMLMDARFQKKLLASTDVVEIAAAVSAGLAA